MSTTITIHLDDLDEARMREVAERLQRDPTDLARCAVSEALLQATKGQPLWPPTYKGTNTSIDTWKGKLYDDP